MKICTDCRYGSSPRGDRETTFVDIINNDFISQPICCCESGVVLVARFCCPKLQTVVTFAVVKDIFSIFDLRVERKISSLMCYLSCIENEREKSNS